MKISNTSTKHDIFSLLYSVSPCSLSSILIQRDQDPGRTGGPLQQYTTSKVFTCISREIEDDVQSATHRQIRPEGVGVARQEETLDAGHGERSSPAHPVGSNAQALCRRRSSFDNWWLVMVGPDNAQAEHAQSVKVHLDRLSKRAEHEVELYSVRARRCVHEYASAHDE